MNQSYRIRIRKGQWLSVYIWDTARELADHGSPYGMKKDSIAFYLRFGSRNKRKGEFGELHFQRKYLGAGCVAHEIQHFMFDWIQSHYKTVTWRVDERLAQICDDVTRLFWRKYYGHK